MEYPFGAYSLDIVFPEQKLNIEIAGPHHYRNGKLKRIHKFRDFILQAYDNWKIIRIPHFEWEPLDDNTQAKKDYLLKKLAHHDYLFNQKSLERLKILNSFLNTTKEDINATDKQISSIRANLAAEAMSAHGIFKQSDSTDAILQKNPNKSSTNATVMESFSESKVIN